MKRVILSIVALFAVVTVWAQTGVVENFNQGATAIKEKRFEDAAKLFESVIDEGVTSNDVTILNCVETAKKYLPTCYQGMGTRFASQKNYEAAIPNLQKAAEIAELYGNPQAMNKANAILAKVYQAQGGEAFNAKRWAEAAEIFAKGYAADQRNTKMANWLGTCYCEMGDYDKGMEILEGVAGETAPRYAEDAKEAQRLMNLYTNNQIGNLQAARNFDAIVALTEKSLAKHADNPSMLKIRLLALSAKGDNDKVLQYGAKTVEAQITPLDKSEVYFILGASYNAKGMKNEAIQSLKKVTVGPNVETAKKFIEELSKQK